VAYGWELTADPEIDFGTNPSNKENYLFLHRLFRKLASISEGRFTPLTSTESSGISGAASAVQKRNVQPAQFGTNV
jgi:hypothetical protein